MDEINSNLQEIKPKTNKLAIVSLVIPIISIIGSYSFLFALWHHYDILIAWLFFIFVYPFLPFIGFILGITSIFTINRRGDSRKGYIYAILGIILSVYAFNNCTTAIGCIRPEARIINSQSNMTKLYEEITTFKKSHNNKLPMADKWCDLILDNVNVDKRVFLRLDSPNRDRWQREKIDLCSYAINPKAEPNSAGDVVLLFETKDGWNQFGGPELMNSDDHYRKGCNVLFNNGSVKFVLPENKDTLNWGP